MVLGTIAGLFGKIFNSTLLGHILSTIWNNKAKILKHLLVDYYLNMLRNAGVPNFLVNGLSNYLDSTIN